MPKIRVLVVDDHTIVRDGICGLLRLAGDIDVVGEAANGREALDKVRQLIPDVMVMDFSMPNMNGLEATRRVHKEFPKVKVLILSQYDDKEYIIPILEAGANGFISKTAASSELVSAVRSVFRGDSFLSPSAARILVDEYKKESSSKKELDFYHQLTDREREILKLLVEGYNAREIADMLFISTKTVEGHKTNLMAKLDIHKRIDLVKYAVRKGIITV